MMDSESLFTAASAEANLDEDDPLAPLSAFIVSHPFSVNILVSVMEAVVMEETNDDNLPHQSRSRLDSCILYEPGSGPSPTCSFHWRGSYRCCVGTGVAIATTSQEKSQDNKYYYWF